MGDQVGLIKGKWGNAKSQYDDIKINPSTNALTTVMYEHHEIHSGTHYYITDAVDLSINTLFDMQFTTPNTTSWVHFNFVLNVEAETLWHIYEGGAVLTAGTTVLAKNSNRNSANTSAVTIGTVAGNNEATTATYTSTASATVIAKGMVGALRSSGVESRSNEIILKQNTTYVFRAFATAAGFISFTAQWYEHADKH